MIIFKCVLCPGWTSHKHFPLADVLSSEAEWVKPGSVRSASSAQSCRSQGIRAALQCWWYSAQHVSPHQRIHLCFGSFETNFHFTSNFCQKGALQPHKYQMPGCGVGVHRPQHPYSFSVSHAKTLIMQCLYYGVWSNYKSIITDIDPQSVYLGPSLRPFLFLLRLNVTFPHA